ncbi:MAG TPA: DUF1587 domain-containing protein, partial [Chloroflexota bacterium]|nr:DUF1587 domain-containing protein [Chloroflexota bacterium]
MAGCTGAIGDPGGQGAPGSGSTRTGGTSGPGSGSGTGSTGGTTTGGSVTPEPGRVTIRRLNQTEYDNTVHDLLGTNTHPAGTFISDSQANGFDNN